MPAAGLCRTACRWPLLVLLLLLLLPMPAQPLVLLSRWCGAVCVLVLQVLSASTSASTSKASLETSA